MSLQARGSGEWRDGVRKAGRSVVLLIGVEAAVCICEESIPQSVIAVCSQKTSGKSSTFLSLNCADLCPHHAHGHFEMKLVASTGGIVQ